jgi:iron complex outermembrane recepter protein
MRKAALLALTGVSLGTTAMAMPALAQDEAEGADEIVVTGTLIRGIEVVGSQTLTVTKEAITEVGAGSTTELLASIPQISSFNGQFEPNPRGARSNSIARPNLRDLPGADGNSGSVTLALVDGYRITPVGVKESSMDVDIIPSIIIEGVDVVTDGGTSLYGADAVAGVINFRTMRSFEGIMVDGNFGFGTTVSAYKQYDASIVAGPPAMHTLRAVMRSAIWS